MADRTVRAATRDDVEVVLDLWQHLNAVQRDVRVYRPTADQDAAARAEILEVIDDPDSCTYLVEADGGPVATMEVVVRHKDGMNDAIVGVIGRLVVLPAYRNRGLAADLIARAEDFARARGATHLSAWVYTGNEPAVRFWSARGFASRVQEVVRPILAEDGP